MISVMSLGCCLMDIPACGRQVFNEAVVIDEVWAGLGVFFSA